MIAKKCDNCGKDFEAKRITAKYCSRGCSARASEKRTSGKSETKPVVLDGNIYRVTKETLDKAQATDTPDGQAALMLATRLDTTAKHEGAMGVASLVREFSAVVEKAIKSVEPEESEEDPLDEIRRRREERERKLGSG